MNLNSCFSRASVALSGAFLLVLATGAAARTVYECQIEDRSSNRGWLPSVVIVAIDEGSDTVLVADPMIEHVHGGPIEIVPDTNTDKRLSLGWKLTLPATNQNELHVSYDFTILKAQKTAKISGLPHGYDNTFSSSGRCKVSKG